MTIRTRYIGALERKARKEQLKKDIVEAFCDLIGGIVIFCGFIAFLHL